MNWFKLYLCTKWCETWLYITIDLSLAHTTIKIKVILSKASSFQIRIIYIMMTLATPDVVGTYNGTQLKICSWHLYYHWVPCRTCSMWHLANGRSSNQTVKPLTTNAHVSRVICFKVFPRALYVQYDFKVFLVLHELAYQLKNKFVGLMSANGARTQTQLPSW